MTTKGRKAKGKGKATAFHRRGLKDRDYKDRGKATHTRKRKRWKAKTLGRRATPFGGKGV
jgi:hypothetical protein